MKILDKGVEKILDSSAIMVIGAHQKWCPK